MFKNFQTKFGLNKRLSLLIPFILVAVLLIIIPLIMILVRSLIPNTDLVTGEQLPISQNWSSVNTTTMSILWKSLWVAFVATVISFILGFSFAYCVARTKSLVFKAIALALITIPIWMALLIKVIGLKIFVQTAFTNGQELLNVGWTIYGLVYVYFPFMVLPLYNTMRDLPPSLIEASLDLGRSKTVTLVRVVIPFCFPAILAGVMLVFLPSVTTVSVSAFMDQSSTGELIGQIIFIFGERGFTEGLFLSNAASLSLIVLIVMVFLYTVIVLVPKLINKLGDYKVKNILKKKTSSVSLVAGSDQ